MDGLISTGRVRTFDDWLKIKGDEFARQKLGPARFDLWKRREDHNLPIDQRGGQAPDSA